MTSLFGPVIACHHWISVTACAGEPANASAVVTAAAAPNCRRAIKNLPLGRHRRWLRLAAPDDGEMTLETAGIVGGKGRRREAGNWWGLWRMHVISSAPGRRALSVSAC